MTDLGRVLGTIDRLLLGILVVVIGFFSYQGYRAINLATESSCCDKVEAWANAVDVQLDSIFRYQEKVHDAICRLEEALKAYHPQSETVKPEDKLCVPDTDEDEPPEPKCTFGACPG